MKNKKILIASVVIAVLAIAGFIFVNNGKPAPDAASARVKVAKGKIVDKALAVGTIEPENEISVKSKVSGVVKKIFVEVGSYVKAGDPLLEVKPDPTPVEVADARRLIEMQELELGMLGRNRVRQESLYEKKLISDKEHDDFEQKYRESELRLRMAKEKLTLLQSGRTRIGNTEIESVIKSPISGFMLSKTIEVGDPVTPLSSFQEGTVLMKMANMENLLFKGTVDEIDVGKLKEGMEVELKVGALPNDTVRGTLKMISLKAEKKENVTSFPIEILIPKSQKAKLRAGYSANASIIIQKKENILTIPERVVEFRGDSAFVRVPLGAEKSEEKYIKTGLSDAISIEVKSGLKEGDELLEKAVKQIQ
ncbi:MAG: efflux RND transporter periplasmic adaptor subunit [Rhizobacter sp.]|nr:efflux RND transporter periplasmic adaptor subunit [Chlorobiales bacterium]